MRKVLLLLAALWATPALAWESDTTHAGLTEGAALASRLDARLRTMHGRAAGMLDLITLAPDGAADLYKKLGMIEPASGVVPDRRGRQTALAWLVAGSVVEGIPGDRDRNHFYDPVRKRGLSGGGGGIIGKLRGEGEVPGGMAAPDWIDAKDNDLTLGRFWLEVERSATSTSKAQRDEHLALALLCAGGLLHVLQDMGVPSHVRDDLAEHLSPLGGGPGDRGSRFERVASFLYGQLGVPAPAPEVVRDRVRDFFTAADGNGLADLINRRFYSAGTLPASVVVPADPRRGEVLARVVAAQRYPSPKPERDLKLGPAPGPDGHVLRDGDGPCLANYRVEDGALRFAISDACAAEQLAVILPQVGGYSVGLLDWLFRGGLGVTLAGGSVVVAVPPGEPALGKGKLMILSEDGEGRRTPIGSFEIAAGQPLPSAAAPAGARRVVAVFKGVDAAGQELVAVGTSP